MEARASSRALERAKMSLSQKVLSLQIEFVSHQGTDLQLLKELVIPTGAVA
jgi:hypothetical protein